MSKYENDRETTPYGIESLQQHLTETKLRLALLQYQKQQDEAWQGEYEALPLDAPQKIEEAHFFEKTEAQTLRLIKKHENSHRRAPKVRRTFKVLPAAAIIVLVLMLSFATVLAVSPQLRIHMIRMLYKVMPQYTEVSFSPDPDHFFDVPEGWQGLYYPAYIPEGYYQTNIVSGKKSSKVVFSANDNHYLFFSEHKLGVESNINSENSVVEEIDINGKTGLIIQNGDYNMIVWANDEKCFTLYVTENADIAIKIAKSVMRIK
ncbi:MAG TPA: DUF4367 domain-containing protein [Candidatus Syntrophosphaera sp.]|jgi:hypothetical protein|nr:DUF4367 domain-containing protein [Candidatus Syntrophosphaera sp.]